DIAREAVSATAGLVLMHDGKICDARFSKCCGGATEVFATCWDNEPHPYLKAFRDMHPAIHLPDLTTEKGASEWILSRPDSFCNTVDDELLGKVLNNFDRSTTDFYRWSVTVDSTALSDLIRRKSGLDFGDIIDITPLQRGPSGRICRLKITGSKLTKTIGKELEIRRLLSPSHLYSSAFIVEKSEEIADGDKKITTFTLWGAGWGHGVGLCQIGAAAMSVAGYDFRQILGHYYPHTTITRAYE
ncbi:MAG: SpoIID/LytB domain-containing protein, partial [Muribaculaceae bacterium]|nr:SpoIID/LytB domain-containing protein [Muribaculaceae bacterium]